MSFTVFQLRIELREVEPAVWRRVMVPGQVKVAQLHTMLQATMGWSDSHLHAFQIGDLSYGPQDDEEEDYDEDEIDETSVTVATAIGSEPGFVYEYDFGDGWEHEVTVEDVVTQEVPMKLAVCLGGENACPPEDVGGPGGYEIFLEALADPTHEEHQNYLSWIGGPFDRAGFDLDGINDTLKSLR